MNRIFGLSLLVCGTLISSRTASGQSDPQAYGSYLRSAAGLESQQQIDNARSYYERAAEAAPSRAERVETWLSWAGMLSRNPGKGDEARRRTSEAEKLYNLALSQSDGDLLLKTRNDFGVFLLRQGEASRAVSLFAQGEGASWSGKDGPVLHARYLYNYGQALESSDHPADAYSRYLEAVRLDPGFEPAREAAARLASQPSAGSGQNSQDPMQPLIGVLLDQNRLPEAGALLRKLADNPDRLRTGDSESYVDLLLRYLTAARLDPAQFERDWRQPLANLRTALPAPTAERLAELQDGYGAELPVDFQPRSAANTFRAWSDPGHAEPFSDFLLMVGNAYAGNGKLRSSLERYSQAVGLAPINSQAALYLTNLLTGYSGQLDPQGELLERWIEISGRGQENARSPEDLRRYVYLDSLLGQHFDERNLPQTAFSQWQKAVQAQERIAALEAGSPPEPFLYERLAASYERLGDIDQAARQYRLAALGYQERLQPAKAAPLLTRIAQIESESSTGVMTGTVDWTTTTTTGTMASTSTTGSYGDDDTTSTTGSYSDTGRGRLPATAAWRPLLGLLGFASLALALVLRLASAVASRR